MLSICQGEFELLNLIDSFYVGEGGWKKSLTIHMTYDYIWDTSKVIPIMLFNCTLLFFQQSFSLRPSAAGSDFNGSQVVVANTINLRRILDMISQSFAGTDFRCLDQNTPENIRNWVYHGISCASQDNFCGFPPKKYMSVVFCSLVKIVRPISSYFCSLSIFKSISSLNVGKTSLTPFRHAKSTELRDRPGIHAADDDRCRGTKRFWLWQSCTSSSRLQFKCSKRTFVLRVCHWRRWWIDDFEVRWLNEVST